jgi:hypothetical protein
MQSEAAERIATEIYDAIHENVATKADIERLEAGLRVERIEAGLRAELRALEQRLDLRFDGMVRSLGAVVVIVSGLSFAALHYWPPHG